MGRNNIIEVADGLWNIRGSFKIGKVIDIGTHATLARRAGGGYVMLDACDFDDDTREWIDQKTGGGARLEAFLHLHPFHTIYVRAAHEAYPKARLYGTTRHHDKLADLPWESLRTEQPELHELFADDFDFTVPRGVALVPDNPKLHFSSVLVVHRATRTLHVDDTILYIRLPLLLRLFGRDLTRFHPTLAKVLEPRPGAVDEFRAWARELIERAADIDNLCAAHSAVLLGRDNRGASIAARLEAALAKLERKLAAHDRRHRA